MVLADTNHGFIEVRFGFVHTIAGDISYSFNLVEVKSENVAPKSTGHWDLMSLGTAPSWLREALPIGMPGGRATPTAGRLYGMEESRESCVWFPVRMFYAGYRLLNHAISSAENFENYRELSDSAKSANRWTQPPRPTSIACDWV